MTAQKVNIKSTEFQPKNEYVLVKPDKVDTSEKTTESGFVIEMARQPSALERSTLGEVIAVGRDICDIVEGDFVLWPGTDGLDFEFNDGNFVLLRYKSIIGSKKVD